MQLLEELEELISSLRAKHPAVAISFSTKVEEKPEDQEPSVQPTSSRKTSPAKHARSAKPPAKKKSPLTSGKFNNYCYYYKRVLILANIGDLVITAKFCARY